MKKTILIILLASGTMVFAQREAYVVNAFAETLSKIDLETGSVENHIMNLGDVPNQAIFHDGYLYVVNSVSADVMKIDPASRQVVADIYLPIGSNPYYASVSDDYCFVTGFVSGAVYRIDLLTNTVDDQIELGEYPEGILYDNGYVYVTQTAFNPDDFSYGQGKITVLNALTLANEGQFNIGRNPQWISRARDGRLHIVCTGSYAEMSGSVYIFDPVSRVIEDSILIGGQPANLAISPLGLGYLAAGGWFDRGLVYAYDVETGDIINGSDNPIYAGLGVTCVAVDSLGYLYTCDMGDDTVTKLSPSGNYIGEYAVGDGPIFMVIVDDAIVGVDPENENHSPDKMAILDNFPNPFNGGTIIRYRISPDDIRPVTIEIYDCLGRLIKFLVPGTVGTSGSVHWDGSDNAGRDCASGLYFARIQNGSKKAPGVDSEEGQKMLMIK